MITASVMKGLIKTSFLKNIYEQLLLMVATSNCVTEIRCCKIFDATNTTKFHGKFESRVNKVAGLRVTPLLKRDSNTCF